MNSEFVSRMNEEDVAKMNLFQELEVLEQLLNEINENFDVRITNITNILNDIKDEGIKKNSNDKISMLTKFKELITNILEHGKIFDT